MIDDGGQVLNGGEGGGVRQDLGAYLRQFLPAGLWSVESRVVLKEHRFPSTDHCWPKFLQLFMDQHKITAVGFCCDGLTRLQEFLPNEREDIFVGGDLIF